MRQEEIVNEIRKKCGHVEMLPLIGWHFIYHGRYLVYLLGDNENMIRFCIPCLTEADRYDTRVVSEAISKTNKNVKFVKAVKLDSGHISLDYDHKTASEESAETIIPHIIDTLDFASTYLLDKLKRT